MAKIQGHSIQSSLLKRALLFVHTYDTLSSFFFGLAASGEMMPKRKRKKKVEFQFKKVWPGVGAAGGISVLLCGLDFYNN